MRMRICASCHEEFPWRVTIAGKRRELVNRKYCLTCSPFGLHNTRRLEVRILTSDCERCGKQFVIDRAKGNTGRFCGGCRVTRRRIKLKSMAVEYMGGKCQRCGYNTSVWALQFHHRDRAKKQFRISGGTPGWDKIRSELDKCDLLCANCHAEVEELLADGLTGKPPHC